MIDGHAVNKGYNHLIRDFSIKKPGRCIIVCLGLDRASFIYLCYLISTSFPAFHSTDQGHLGMFAGSIKKRPMSYCRQTKAVKKLIVPRGEVGDCQMHTVSTRIYGGPIYYLLIFPVPTYYLNINSPVAISSIYVLGTYNNILMVQILYYGTL